MAERCLSNLASLEYFLLTSPTECVSHCVEYMGFSSFLALSSANTSIFCNTFRLERAWRFFGYDRKLSGFLLDLIDDGAQYTDPVCVTGDIATRSLDVPSHSCFRDTKVFTAEHIINPTLHDPSYEGDSTIGNIFKPIPNRYLFASIGMESHRWKSQKTLDEATQRLAGPTRSYFNKSRCKSFGISHELVNREKKLSYKGFHSIETIFSKPRTIYCSQTLEVRMYLTNILANGLSLYNRCIMNSFNFSENQNPENQISQKLQSCPLLGFQNTLISRNLPLISICNGEMYVANCCSGTHTVPPLRLPVVPKTIGFWPKSLLQGAASQLPGIDGGYSTLLETKGTFGRSNIATAGWASIECENEQNCASALSSVLQSDVSSVCKSVSKITPTGLPTRFQRESFLPLFCLGFLATAYHKSVSWPMQASSYMKEELDEGLSAVGIFSIFQKPCPPHSRNYRQNALTSNVSECPLPRTRQEVFVAFIMKPDEELSAVDATILRKGSPPHSSSFISSKDRYLLNQKHIQDVVIDSHKSDKVIDYFYEDKFEIIDIEAKLHADEEFQIHSSQNGVEEDGFTIMNKGMPYQYKGRIVVGTTKGRILCSRPFLLSNTQEQGDSDVKERAKFVWTELHELCSSVINQNQSVRPDHLHDNLFRASSSKDISNLNDEKFKEYCVDVLKTNSKIAESFNSVLSKYQFNSLAEVHAVTLSDGIIYDEIYNLRRPVTSIKLIQGCFDWTYNKNSSWILCLSKNSFLIIFRYNSVTNHWDMLFQIEGPVESFQFQQTSGILAFFSMSDSKIYFFSLHAFKFNEKETFHKSDFIYEVVSPSFRVRHRCHQNIHPFFGTFVTSSSSSLVRPLKGCYWISAVNKSIRLLKVNLTNKEIDLKVDIKSCAVLNGHSARIYRCEFDGVRRIASIDTNETLIVWDIWKNQKLFSISLYRSNKQYGSAHNACHLDIDTEEEEEEDEDDEKEEENYSKAAFITSVEKPSILLTDSKDSFCSQNISQSSSSSSFLNIKSSTDFPSFDMHLNPHETDITNIPSLVEKKDDTPLNVWNTVALRSVVLEKKQLSQNSLRHEKTTENNCQVDTSQSESTIENMLLMSKNFYGLEQTPLCDLLGTTQYQSTNKSLTKSETTTGPISINDSEIFQLNKQQYVINEMKYQNTNHIKDSKYDNDIAVKALHDALLTATQINQRSIEDEYADQLRALQMYESLRVANDNTLALLLQNNQRLIDDDPKLNQVNKTQDPLMEGLLRKTPSEENKIKINPQSREILWLDITPNRLAVLYKKDCMWQSWTF